MATALIECVMRTQAGWITTLARSEAVVRPMLVMAAALLSDPCCSLTFGIWVKSAGPASAGPAYPRLVLLHVVLRHAVLGHVVLLVHHAAGVGHLAVGHCVSLLVHFAVHLGVLRHAGL